MCYDALFFSFARARSLLFYNSAFNFSNSIRFACAHLLLPEHTDIAIAYVVLNCLLLHLETILLGLASSPIRQNGCQRDIHEKWELQQQNKFKRIVKLFLYIALKKKTARGTLVFCLAYVSCDSVSFRRAPKLHPKSCNIFPTQGKCPSLMRWHLTVKAANAQR